MKSAGGIITFLGAGAVLAVLAACGSQPSGADGDLDPAVVEVEENDGDDARVQTERMDALDRMDDTCGMAAIRPYLGEMTEAIPMMDLPSQTRFLTPSSQATMDYVPTRLNVLTNEDGMVIGLKCG